jgi:hypothetical protein
MDRVGGVGDFVEFAFSSSPSASRPVLTVESAVLRCKNCESSAGVGMN